MTMTHPKVDVQMTSTSNLVCDCHLQRFQYSILTKQDMKIYLVIDVEVLEEAFLLACSNLDHVRRD